MNSSQDQTLYQFIDLQSCSIRSEHLTTATGFPMLVPGDATNVTTLTSPQTAFTESLYLVIGVTLMLGAATVFYLVRSLVSQGKAILHLSEDRLQIRQPVAAPPSNPAVECERASVQHAETAVSPKRVTPNVTATAAANGRRQFKLLVAKDLLPLIHNYVTEFQHQHGADNEAGGMLVGEYSNDDDTGTATFQVRGFIEAGPKAEFSPGSIMFDGQYQIDALRVLRFEHLTVANIGCVHLHPGEMDVCSLGDTVTDREAAEASDTKALVFAIITINNSRQGSSSLVYRDFKLDFYLMAEETGFEYVPLAPTLTDAPLLEASPAMNALVAVRGFSAVDDLAVTRGLWGIESVTLSALDGGKEGALLTAKVADSNETLHVWARPRGDLSVFVVEGNGGKKSLAGPWEKPEVGQHVWLSHLLRTAREHLPQHHSAARKSRHFASLVGDKQRLVAEVHAMKERYGDRATLRRRGETLYWECTIRESGRSFPIRIEYPAGYPFEPPRIFSEKSLPSSPHQLGQNEICWINHFTAQSEWNPSRDTAAVAVAAAQRWFACLLVYLTLRVWPEGAER